MLGFSTAFQSVALPAEENRCHFEPPLNLWVVNLMLRVAEGESPLREWPGLWRRSVSGGVGKLKHGFPNYFSEIALEENCQEECRGWKCITCKIIFHDSKAAPPFTGLEEEQVSQNFSIHESQRDLPLPAPTGNPKIGRVLTIRLQNRRAVVFTFTGNVSVQVQPAFLNKGFVLKNKSCTSLQSSAHSAEERSSVFI